MAVRPVEVPESVLGAGIPHGTSSCVSLPQDAWDLLALGGSDCIPEKDWQVKNGQVALLTAADHAAVRRISEAEEREAHRQRWQQEAEARLAKALARKTPLERAMEINMKQQKFAWSKDGQKSFEWRKLYHALLGDISYLPEGGFVTECVISPTAMRMYTDHRVMGAVVLPGVSHVSLMAAAGCVGLPSPGGLGDFHISIKEVLFERPYIINSGAELISAIEAGQDPKEIGVPLTYCRASSVTKELGVIKPAVDWTK